MPKRTRNSGTAEPAVTAAVLRLVYGGLSRDDLDNLAVRMQELLDEHTTDIADGATASVDFDSSTIEIDVSIDGDSVAALTNMVGALLERLAPFGVLRTAPLADDQAESPTLTEVGVLLAAA